ncbi:MAG: DNA repair protein RecO [Sedimentisphaerales bacterium]|nr:DNA repair protein RecO [Sedimentisphaerales bacterium]
MLTKDQAICIRVVDYSETSQVVTFFTRSSGKIGAIAKGSKRPKSSFDGPIEMLSRGRIVFAGSNREKLTTLTEFESSAGTAGPALLRKDLFNLNCCLLAAEILNSLTDEHDPHLKLFDSFGEFIENAENAESKSEMLALLVLFQLALLKEVGLGPILDHCINCKAIFDVRHPASQLYFSSSANGLICKNCESAFQDKFKLSKNAAAVLTNLRLLAETDDNTLAQIEKLLVYHFTELTGRRPKMAKHILVS